MGKRGPKPKGKVKIKWSSDFAYAIGLITTDGNLSPDGRHINFTTKDGELAELFKQCLGLENRIGKKARGGEKEKKYYCLQFGDILFYKFLLGIGLMPCKSKVLKELKIPEEYFFGFLRGCFDGDGSSYSYRDPRWKSSFMFYISIASASPVFIHWVKSQVTMFTAAKGHITKDKNGSTYQLKYAKADSLRVLRRLYCRKDIACLLRKKLKIMETLAIVGESL